MHVWKWRVKLKTSITFTYIPHSHFPLSSWHKGSNCYPTHDTKVEAHLPHHHPHSPVTLFPVPHKSVYSHSDWANWASRPFCLLEERLVPRLSSYWKSHLPQGLMGCICVLRRVLFSFVCFYFPCGGKKTQTRSCNKMHIQGDVFHFSQDP